MEQEKKPRKPRTKKVDNTDNINDTELPKRRVRKKNYQINSIEKLREEDISKDNESNNNNKVLGSSKEVDNDEVLNHSYISYGKLNIIVKKKPEETPEERKQYFDNIFKITDEEKSSKLMQENSNIVIPEPISDIEYKTNNKFDRKNKNVRNKEFHTLLEKFINNTKSAWPEKTDILCWHCCHSFDNSPIPCPIDYDELRERYKVIGIFCSWSCVARYSLDNYSSLSILYRFKEKIEGNEFNDDILIAPPRICLKDFGGYMDINKFRSFNNKTNTLLISTEDLNYVNQEICELKM